MTFTFIYYFIFLQHSFNILFSKYIYFEFHKVYQVWIFPVPSAIFYFADEYALIASNDEWA